MMKSNIQESEQGAHLIRPEQIRLLDDDMEIVLIKGQPPLLVKKVKYYEDKILKKLFDNQSGPLPEPDPVINKPPVLMAVTAPSPALAATEDAVDDEETLQNAQPEAPAGDIPDAPPSAGPAQDDQSTDSAACEPNPSEPDSSSDDALDPEYPPRDQWHPEAFPEEDGGKSAEAEAAQPGVDATKILQAEDRMAEVALSAQAALLEKIKKLQSAASSR